MWLAVSTEILLSFIAQVGGIFVLREGKNWREKIIAWCNNGIAPLFQTLSANNENNTLCEIFYRFSYAFAGLRYL